MSKITIQDKHTILAALRAYQHLLSGATLSREDEDGTMMLTAESFTEIASKEGYCEPLGIDQIDTLIEERLY